MRSRKILGVARKTFGPEELDRLQRFVVRIMTCTAPQPAIALARTTTSRKLLHVTDNFEFLSIGAGWRSIAVRGENLLQSLTRPKVTKILAWIQDSSHSQQVTLLADAVARSRLQLRWVDDRACPRIAEMLFRRAMTSLTGDRLSRKCRDAILVRGTRYV
jgi:hypothetical protein